MNEYTIHKSLANPNVSISITIFIIFFWCRKTEDFFHLFLRKTTWFIYQNESPLTFLIYKTHTFVNSFRWGFARIQKVPEKKCMNTPMTQAAEEEVSSPKNASTWIETTSNMIDKMLCKTAKHGTCLQWWC